MRVAAGGGGDGVGDGDKNGRLRFGLRNRRAQADTILLFCAFEALTIYQQGQPLRWAPADASSTCSHDSHPPLSNTLCFSLLRGKREIDRSIVGQCVLP